MTSNVLKSAQSSVILRNLEEQQVKDLSYDVGVSYPILAKQCVAIEANSTAAVTEGGEIVFNITKALLLRDMMIQSTFTNTSTSMLAGVHVGLTIFEWVKLRTNNKTLLTMTDSYIWARTQQCSESTQNGIFRRALPLIVTTEIPTTGTGLILTTYTPVFSSFFESVNNAFDLNFYEQMSLACKVNTLARGGFGTALTTVTAKLWVWLYTPDDKFYNLLTAKNQNPAQPLTMLCYDTDSTGYQVLTSQTVNTMRMNISAAVFNTYIMIRPIKATIASAQVRIDSFDLRLGGVSLLESIPYLVGNWESCKFGASSLQTTSITAVTYDDSKCIALNWGMEPWNRVTNSGAISFGQINYPTITLYTSSSNVASAADYAIYVVHEYWNALALDSNNGSVSIAVSV